MIIPFCLHCHMPILSTVCRIIAFDINSTHDLGIRPTRTVMHEKVNYVGSSIVAFHTDCFDNFLNSSALDASIEDAVEQEVLEFYDCFEM